ncbi:hypothetical protein AZH53_01200 [Methanomicrobiaceae archaeon CYW5]|uniref:hypothetical protein n=1 Tax=Methanovulcanius yangii TaxID=1789227 RepID=UPI0029CA9692|nr:hypothetical protein [Methanovulcanius yangii]MBT8507045.1 hypothetical protein [Methanovulcanius yangii]
MKNRNALVVVVVSMLLIISAGCTDGVWDRLWGTGDKVDDLSTGLNDTDGSGSLSPAGGTPTPSMAAADTNGTGADITPAGVGVGNESTSALPTPTTVAPVSTTEAGDDDEGEAGSFSIQYTPPDGYVAEEGETLAMIFTIVPVGGFDDPVRVTLDLSVPDPVFGIFSLWSESYDMGTHMPPYPPITQTLLLDPENPPDEYAWVTDVYDTARSAGISELDVKVHVSATGGGMTVEERPVYHVRLA